MGFAKIIRIIAFAAGLILILVLAAISYRAALLNEQAVAQDVDEKLLLYDSFSDYIVFKGVLFEQGSEYSRAYSVKDMELLWEMPQQLSKPEQVILNDELYVFERDGRTILKLDKTGIRARFELEDGGILKLVAASRSLIGVIYGKEGYRTSLLLVDRAFGRVFERAYSNSFVTDAYFSDRSQLLVLLNSSSGDELRSYLETVDINSGEVINETILGKEIFIEILPGPDKGIYTISGSRIIFLLRDLSIIEIFATDELEAIYQASPCNGGLMLLVGEKLHTERSPLKAAYMQYVSVDPEESYSFEADPGTNEIYCVKRLIAAVTNTGIIIYDSSGDILNNMSGGDIIEETCTYGDAIYVMRAGSIDTVYPEEEAR